MTSLLDGPFQQVERRAGLVLGTTLSTHRGQARLVCLLDSHPGWVYKEYHDVRQQAADTQLDRLIAFPARLTAAEQTILQTGTSWPASRVVADRRTVGVIMPLAPDSFTTAVRLPSGPQSMLLPIDLLAQSDVALQRRAIPAQSTVDRVLACLSLVTTAELLERHGIVYLDWSYANAFWSPRSRAVYVIDVDGSSFGPRKLIECPGWEDPLVPMGSTGGNAVDRYRVALMVGRCLTTVRPAADVPAALTRLASTEPRLRDVCRRVASALGATVPGGRPPIAELAEALRTAAAALGVVGQAPAPPPPTGNGAGHNVTEWKSLADRRVPRQRTPEPQPAPEPVPVFEPEPEPLPVGQPEPWTRSVPVPTAEPGLSSGAVAALVVLGIVLAFILLAVIF